MSAVTIQVASTSTSTSTSTITSAITITSTITITIVDGYGPERLGEAGNGIGNIAYLGAGVTGGETRGGVSLTLVTS